MIVKTFALLTASLAFASQPASAADSSIQRSCSAKTRMTYGFQCQGWAAVADPNALEPVSFVGTVSGSSSGRFDGTGVFNSTFGRLPQNFSGQGIFTDRQCSGSIAYDVWVRLPNGDNGPPLPGLYVDFVTVRGGREILGVPSNPVGGAVGAAVPRMNCRLVQSD